MERRARRATQGNLGFLLAKASQRWNEILYGEFSREQYPDVRPAYGSILVPLFEEDGLRMGELGRRARLSKQAMTTMVKLMERNRLVVRRRDPTDARAFRIFLTPRTRRFKRVVERVLRIMDGMVERRLSPAQTAVLKQGLKILMTLDSSAHDQKG